MATGTPVIAFDLGSMPEIITPSITGYLVRDVADALACVATVAALNRQDCRDDVVARFSAARMVDDYADLFADIVDGGPSASS